jgi:transcription antitermination factor NusG
MGSGQEYKNKWFVLYTRNKKETEAREGLDFESIVPLEEKVKIKNVNGERNKKIELKPKYQNYVFVKHDGSESFFEKCLENKLIVSFAGGTLDVKNNKFPEPLSLEEVENILNNELSRNVTKGNEVEIIEGPYVNQKGRIISSNDEECKIEIRLTNITIVETIPLEFIKKQ